VSFFYTLIGDYMTIYLDLIFLLNFFLDFILFLSVSVILKRNASIIRIIFGALIGMITMISLFINIGSLTLFFIKFIMSILMCLISFSYKNIKYTINNIIYLYIVSILLGGFLYFINDSVSLSKVGPIFINNGVSINLFIVLLISPIVLYLYIKQIRILKEEISRKYNVSITFLNNKTINIIGFLDTGNNLYDPYKKRPILVINRDLIKYYKPKFILVPCVTVNNESLIKCFKIKELKIDGKKITKEVLIGISDNNFNIDGVELLLHKNIIKEI